MLQVGSILDGKYKILRKIGQGGASAVYLAVNERVNKKWAIKEIRRDGRISVPLAKQSLASELHLLKTCSHPGLPSIVDVIEWEGFFLLVMEYVEGQTLGQILSQRGAQPQEQVVRWGIQLCEVLGYLHNQTPPVIYGDMKPENVMVRPDGHVVLIDFGTAFPNKHARQQGDVCIGTVGYAAPERYQSRASVDVRADIYSLGATMYHLLTGIHPATLPKEAQFFSREKKDASWKLENIIWICTQRRPQDRYATCKELQKALHKCLVNLRNPGRRYHRLRRCCLAFTLLSGAAFLGAAGFFVAEHRIRHRAYQQYLEDAVSLADQEEKCRAYEQAILLNPREGEAYLRLLEECFLADYVMTAEEDERLRRILGVASGMRRSNENALKRNTEDYEAFAYQAAMAYYYYFEDGDNKSCAVKWLDVVRDAATLEPAQAERGERLGNIAEYYNSIGIAKPDTGEVVTYLDYWQDLKELVPEELPDTENLQTATAMYGELISQIYRHCDQFEKAGVTREDMEHQIRQVEAGLAEAVGKAEQKETATALSERISQIREGIGMTRRVMETVYGEGKGGIK